MSALHHLDAARALDCHHSDEAESPASPAMTAALRLLRRVADLTAGNRTSDTSAALTSSFQATFIAGPSSRTTQESSDLKARCPRCEINERMAAMILDDLVTPHLTRLGLLAEANEARALVRSMMSSPGPLALV